MSSKVFKVGIIGTGFIGAGAHIPALLKLRPDVEITAIADSREDALRHAAEYYGIEKTYTDPYQMLKENTFDLVQVCTANCTHKEFSIAALRAGCHVLCEKPLALTLKDAREMFAEADKAGKQLFAIQNTRVGTAQNIRKLYEKGILGDVYYTEVESIRRRGVPTWGRFHVMDDNGAGAFCDIGVHAIDALMFALGNPKLSSVSASTFTKIACDYNADEEQYNALHGEHPYLPRKDYDYREFSVDEFSAGMARFENGMQMMMKFSWAVNMPSTESYRIMGTKAGLLVDKNAHPNRMTLCARDEENFNYNKELLDNPDYNGHDVWIAHIIRVIKGEEESLITREEMLNVVSVIDAFYKSASLGREVTVAELED